MLGFLLPVFRYYHGHQWQYWIFLRRNLLQTFMLALALMLILEGVGPLLFPNKWRRYLNELSNQNQQVLRRIGGSLVTAGLVILIIFS